MVLLNGHEFSRRSHGVRLFRRIDIKTSRRFPQRFLIGLLAFPAQKPVDEEFTRIGMGRILDHRQSSRPGHRVSSILELRERFYRKARLNKGTEVIDVEAYRDRHTAFDQQLAQRPLFSHDDEILLHELFKKFLTLRSKQKCPVALPRAARAWITVADFTLPFGVNQIVISADLLGLHKLRVVPNGLLHEGEK